jgi:hypothetical protein
VPSARDAHSTKGRACGARLYKHTSAINHPSWYYFSVSSKACILRIISHSAICKMKYDTNNIDEAAYPS